MTANGVLQIAIYLGLMLLLVKPMGGYMTRVFNGQHTPLDAILRPLERTVYRLARVNPASEQHWTIYTAAMLLFNLAGCALLYLLQRLQHILPLNPAAMPPVPPDVAFNTAVSFTTNTNWQAYAGESTMSPFIQMVGLTVQNFVSAATGIALSIALIRAFARDSAHSLGSFWVDLTRATLWILLPLSFVLAVVLVWQGVPQTLRADIRVQTVEGALQKIAQGPVASQESIKMLGTNGGGFFNANSAHPYENPTPLTNLLEMLAIFAIGAGLTNTFGRMVGDPRQGWALLAAMLVLWLAGVGLTYWAESAGNPAIAHCGVDVHPSPQQSGGNMEGKEVRFGMVDSALFAVATTDASCGAVNGSHDSYTPLGEMVLLANILLGEVIVGGVGSGLYGMLLFAVLSVFLAGLMVGRTPEYLGKKIECTEVKMTVLAILVLPASILGFTALACLHPEGLKGPTHTGPHGFSQILYAFTSGTGNNGSALAGLNANTVFYNLTTALAMLIGRFGFIIPMMAVAGSLVGKKVIPASEGTFPTTGGLFVALLVGVILIVGGLTYFPAISLGPVVEHLMMTTGKLY